MFPMNEKVGIFGKIKFSGKILLLSLFRIRIMGDSWIWIRIEDADLYPGSTKSRNHVGNVIKNILLLLINF